MSLADEIRNVLSDTMNLPPDFLDYVGVQYPAQNRLSVQAVRSPTLVSTGTTGATAASRYVGATTSGAPASGTFQVGDFVLDQSGAIWVCTAAGSPGTWGKIPVNTAAPAAEIGYDTKTSFVNITGLTSVSTTTVITGSAHTFDGSPVIAEFFAPAGKPPSVSGQTMTIGLYESGSQVGILGQMQNNAAAVLGWPVLLRWRLTPSAGSHTYSVQAWVTSTTGTPNIGGGAGGSGNFPPCYLRFTKV